MATGLDQIKRWGEQICTLADTDPKAIVAALAVPAAALVDTGEHAGAFARIALGPDGATWTRADCDKVFGPRNDLPRVGAGRAYQCAYQIRVAGAPYTCAVIAKIADFDEMPNDASVVTEVTLRRDRAPS